ncbi:sensor domain-containing diguanylate cyclase [Deinococcus ruber]|uniref:Sensor histidine kinase n=1 Tax=Deinococcus ruber TaxID=1848197 RepID=A0A918F9Z7_9DEIO|nr:diguanylate cyclase [Deinococcus ruber]GGR19598.1 sensor histidine kinase [Deinococcus ruber]
MRLRTYLLRSQAPLWAVLVLFGAAELVSTRSNLLASRQASQAQQELSGARALMKTVVDLETGVRGYVITGDPAFLQPYTEARTRFGTQMDVMQALELEISDELTPAHQAQLRAISDLLTIWYREVASVDIRGRQGDPERVIALEKSGRGKHLIDGIRAQVDQFEQAETRQLTGLTARAAEASLINEVVTFTGALLAILVSVLGSRRVARTLGENFGQLADAAGTLASSAPAEPVTGFQVTEAERLADSFNRMAADLARTYRTLSEQNRLLNLRNADVRATSELAEALQTCATVDESHHVLRSALPQLFRAVSGTLATMNASKNLMDTQVRWEQAGREPAVQTPGVVFEPSACWAIRTGRTYDPQGRTLGAPCLVPGSHGEHLCLPLLAHGEVIGTLRLQDLPEAAEDAAALRELAVTVAGQIGLGLSNLRLRETLRHQSIRDPLTGLFNRRYLDETFERELRRAERQGAPLSVMMLDVDHFKRFNDTHGHDAGDAVLITLGRLLQDQFRREDIVCRYGGEEFAVLMEGASLREGLARAERLRIAAAELPLDFQGRPLGHLTLSIGVTAYPEGGKDTAALTRQADRALYRAKHEGRNCVIAGEAQTEA